TPPIPTLSLHDALPIYHRFTPAYHFGEITWGEFAIDHVPGQRFYEGESDKSDVNLYAKVQYRFTDRLNGFADVQWRRVAYTTARSEEHTSELQSRENLV